VPGYEQLEIDDTLLSGALVPVASGLAKHAGQTAIRIKNKYAALHVTRLQPDQRVEIPEAPYLHLFVPRGSIEVEGAGVLRSGDAVRFTGTGGQQITAVEAAEVLIWEMHAAISS
jgi:redox-sensitive bicupin YhaK (pirin superfamily)